MTGGEAQRDDEVPADRHPVAPDDPRVRELFELVGHVRVLAGSLADRATHPSMTARAGAVPPPTQDVLDEVDRMEAGLRAVARTNSDAGARTAKHAARRGRVERCVVALVVVAALVWVADNALGYMYSTPAQLPVLAAGRGARVEVPHVGERLVDCWNTGSVENVWKVAPPFDRLAPYRCGDGAAAILVPGPMSVFALGTAFFGTLVLMWSWWRRRRGTWY